MEMVEEAAVAEVGIALVGEKQNVAVEETTVAEVGIPPVGEKQNAVVEENTVAEVGIPPAGEKQNAAIEETAVAEVGIPPVGEKQNVAVEEIAVTEVGIPPVGEKQTAAVKEITVAEVDVPAVGEKQNAAVEEITVAEVGTTPVGEMQNVATEEITVTEVGIPLMDEKQNPAIDATDTCITSMDAGQKLVSTEAACTNVNGEHVEEKDSFQESGGMGQESSTVEVEGNELSTAGVEGIEEQEEQEEEEIDIGTSRFKVGDFVWSKIKNHPWWPGQIFDHSDASDHAAKLRRGNRFLVMYFGNKTFAWCYPSQLRPFCEAFQVMSAQSSSKTFLSAVDVALGELSRCVKLEMICCCVPAEPRATLVRPVVVNAGIKEGVSGPQGRVGELPIVEFNPASFVSRLRGFAQAVSETSMLELTVLISHMSVLRWVKGYGCLLPQETSDLSNPEDNSESQISDNTEYDCQRGHTHDPHKEDCDSSAISSSIRKSGKRLSQRGSHMAGERYQIKKRSMAELLQDNTDPELETDSGNMTEEGKVIDKSHLSFEKQMKIDHAASAMVDNEDKNGIDAAKDGKSATSSRKRKKTKHFSSPSILEEINGLAIKEDDAGQGAAILNSPRIRKKSKYLSPPYTMLGGFADMLSSKDIKTGILKSPRASRVTDSISRKDVDIETPKAIEGSQNGEGQSRIAGQLILSPTLRMCSGETSQKEVLELDFDELKAPSSSSPQIFEVNDITTFEFDASADKMLSEFLSTAQNPLYLKGKRSSNEVKGFFVKYRSLMYVRGPDFDIYNKQVTDFERTLRGKEQDSLEKNSGEVDASEDKFGPGGRERNLMPTEPNSVGKDSDEADQCVLKFGSSGGERKSQSNRHVPSGNDSQANQFVPKSGSDVSEGKSLSTEHLPLGNDSNEANHYVPKSVSRGRKRKSLSNDHFPSGKDSNEINQSQGKIGRKAKKRKDKGSIITDSNRLGHLPLERGVGNFGVGVNRKEANGDIPAALLLTFAPGFPLPSKEDLIKIFSKFGVLIESETAVSRESSCAQIVYARSSDAEASSNSFKSNAFGPSIVNCQLQYLSGAPRSFEMNSGFRLPTVEQGGIFTPPPSSKAVNGPPLRVIQQNLEIMRSMLSDSAEKDSSAEKLSPEVRANLTGEIEGLLKKINDDTWLHNGIQSQVSVSWDDTKILYQLS